MGVNHDDISRLIGVSKKTLYKYYDAELKLGKAKANAKVAQSLFSQAMSGNTAAAIFWMKAQAGWREKQVVEVEGKITLEQLVANSLKKDKGGAD